MRRIKSIDVFRGLSMQYMVVGHLINWWIINSQFWVFMAVLNIFDFLGPSAFLFVSGMSITLSLRIRLHKADIDPNYTEKTVLKEHYYRTLLILALAFGYNTITFIWVWGAWGIWSWFILQTIAFSYLVGYPLIKLKKSYRIVLSFLILFITYPIFAVLEGYASTKEGLGILYHFLFHPWDQDSWLPFFAYFVLGTVIGEEFYEIYSIDDEEARKKQIKERLVRNLLVLGVILILAGILIAIFVFNDPILFSIRKEFPWSIYVYGCALVIIAFFTYIHEFKLSPDWKHPFLFYMSFYSLTIYLAHNLVAFLFWEQLDVVTVWLPIGLFIIIHWYVYKRIYNKFGSKASLKNAISKIAIHLSKEK